LLGLDLYSRAGWRRTYHSERRGRTG